MKKLLQSIFSYTTKTVRDANTLQLEEATYIKVLGLVVKTIYKPAEKKDIIPA
jgi:hypothetical protein